MAGLGSGNGAQVGSSSDPELRQPSARRHFATISWLRWRIFVNSLRGKGAAGELVVKILSYPFLAIVVLGPSIGAGFVAYYFVHRHEVSFLALPLWGIFALWQFIGVSTSATGPSFDLSSLVRFPIRYRDYLLIRLSFGLLDPPTIAGICCLLSMSIGIAFAEPSLFPWAAVALFIYAVCNVFFSRMVYSWMERWLATRRTREIVTGLILVVSLGMQFAGQFAQRLGDPTRHGHHAPLSPFLRQTIHTLTAINWLLPPGLTAASIDHFHNRSMLIAVLSLAGLLLFTGLFLLVFQLRLRAEYFGEDLSETPSAAKSKSVRAKVQFNENEQSSAAFSFLPATVAAGLIKEIRYLLRSGPKLYVLVMPVFITFIFSMRTSGLALTGYGGHGMRGMFFAYGCAYTQLIFVSLLYNSLGGDGSGVQFYFIAPLRMRDVMLAKNLLTFGIFAIEAVLIYITAAFVSAPAPLDLTVATLAWSGFALLLNCAIGNWRSIVSPKGVDTARVRSQNVSGMNSLISMATIAVCVGLGAGVLLLCRFLDISLWVAAGAFGVLAIGSFITYYVVLEKMDSIAASHIEDLTRALSKTA
jgi:ABC-2 type transport system permease protein